MKIEFRSCSHDPMEVTMGQAIWFKPINGIDGISATANTEGFTPLTSIANAYDWDRNLISGASRECNSKQEIAIVKQAKPTLFLVPKTKGNSDTEFLIKDLISAVNEMKIKNLHLTHFGFIQKELPKNEIVQILRTILNSEIHSTIETIVWDVDSRVKQAVKTIVSNLNLNGGVDV